MVSTVSNEKEIGKNAKEEVVLNIYLIHPMGDITEDMIRIEFAESREEAILQACQFYVDHTCFKFMEEDFVHYYPDTLYYHLLRDERGLLYDPLHSEEWTLRSDLQGKSKEEIEEYERVCFVKNVRSVFNGNEELMREYIDTTEHNTQFNNNIIYGYPKDVCVYLMKAYYFEIKNSFVVKEIVQPVSAT